MHVLTDMVSALFELVYFKQCKIIEITYSQVRKLVLHYSYGTT